ncbi:MAG TPA: type II toxin-antitoxin system RelE/ParE family toxin [Patescibacteria group bacterium]|nr:type II toxin-antitoxin system RelE/ParE family toxin [Patescibacteria group bacterium]
MDKITKLLQKLSDKERQKVKTVLTKLLAGETSSLDIKKLKDRSDIFRVRIGDLRIIYRTDSKEKIVVLTIARRNEEIYRI